MDVRHLSNNAGSSILGVLVGAAAMLVVGLAVSQLIQTQADMVSYMEDRLSAVNLKSDIMVTLNDQDACLSTLNENHFNEVANSESPRAITIKNAAGTDVYTNESKFDKLNLKSIQVKPKAPIAANGTGSVIISISPERTRGKVVRDLASINLEKRVTLGATMNVVQCEDVTAAIQDEGLADLVPGQIKNISGGCTIPKDISKEADDIKKAQDLWTKKCEQMTFPQAKASYNIYGVSQSGEKKFMRYLIEDPHNIAEYRIEKLSGGSNEESVDPQIRGPYANSYQCINDGIMPLGASYRLDSDYQTDTGTGSGQSSSRTGRCAGGTW